MATFELTSLLARAGIEFRLVSGERSTSFDAILPIHEAVPGALLFVRRPDDATPDLLRSSPARVFLIPRAWGETRLDELAQIDAAIVLVESPRHVVSALLQLMHPEEDVWPSGIHPTALIDPGAVLDPSVSVGPFAVIGRAVIGAQSRVAAYTCIKDNVTIGSRVTIREHCNIGGAGFGFVQRDDGTMERVPHVGSVVIEDDVDVFPYSNIDRGTLGATRVGRGVKLDHYVHVGHNSTVGADCVLTAGVVLCGKSTLGPRVWVGVGSIVKEGIKIGAEAKLGLGAVAIRDVDAGTVVAGVPAKPLQR